MRAFRFGLSALAAGLALGAPALGQSAAPPTSNTAAPETVGPRELQNFNLNGTVTRQAEPAQPSSSPPAGRTTAPRPSEAATTQSQPRPAAVAEKTDQTPAPVRTQTARPTTAAPALSIKFPPPSEADTVPAGAVPAPGFSPEISSPAATATPEQGLTLWPWLLAVVIGGGAALLLWRRRSGEAYAGGPHVGELVTPEPPVPAPRVAPDPPLPRYVPPPEPPKPVGLVSSKLRPWIDLAFKPLRCTVDQDQLTLDFEIELFNSGGSPARDVLVEACMFGAGPTQQQDIAAFFTKTPAPETPVAMIAPLQRLNFRTSLVAKRSALAAADVGGQPMLVPVMAFNAVYRSGGSEARTSVSYLLGREAKGDKLAPFKADGEPRAYASLDARPLPMGARV